MVAGHRRQKPLCRGIGCSAAWSQSELVIIVRSSSNAPTSSSSSATFSPPALVNSSCYHLKHLRTRQPLLSACAFCYRATSFQNPQWCFAILVVKSADKQVALLHACTTLLHKIRSVRVRCTSTLHEPKTPKSAAESFYVVHPIGDVDNTPSLNILHLPPRMPPWQA